MLPTNRPLTVEEINAVAGDAKRWMRERRFSATTISRKLGVGYSPSVLSQFLNGLYRGDCERVARAMNELMERDAGAQQTPRPDGFVETEAAKRMLVTIRTAIQTRSVGEVIGPAGVGKTMTARCAATIYTGSIYLRVLETTRSPYGLLADLSRAVNIPGRGNMTMRLRQIIEHLKGTDRPLLVDEAHKLRPAALEILRDVHDASEVPLILFGTKDLRDNLSDTGMFYGQFTSRIVARCDVTEMALHPKHPRPLFTIDEIRKVFEGSKVKLTGDGAKFLTELACVPGLGGLRICEKLLMIASRIRALQDKPIDGAILNKIFRQMHTDRNVELAVQRREQLRIAVA